MQAILRCSASGGSVGTWPLPRVKDSVLDVGKAPFNQPLE